jgi:hypothetical protein
MGETGVCSLGVQNDISTWSEWIITASAFGDRRYWRCGHCVTALLEHRQVFIIGHDACHSLGAMNTQQDFVASLGDTSL